MDIGAGYELKTNKFWAMMTLVGAVVLTAALWAYLLGITMISDERRSRGPLRANARSPRSAASARHARARIIGGWSG